MEEFAENKVEEMSLYIEEQEQQLNEVAGTWGCASSFSCPAATAATASSAGWNLNLNFLENIKRRYLNGKTRKK